MKRGSLPVQHDLFDSAAPPPLSSLQLNHKELVELLSRLLWEVATNGEQPIDRGSDDEQDQR